MWPSHFDKSLPHGRHRLGSDEKTFEFCFGGRRHDKLDDLGDDEDWAIESRDIVVFQEEDVCAYAAAVFGLVEICSVRMPTEHHVSGAIGDAVFWLCGDVVKHLVDGL